MCLAIYRPEGRAARIAPTIAELEWSDANGNGDSVGVMWRTEDGRLKTWRQVAPRSMHALHGLLCSLGRSGYAYAAHMRLATHGAINAENAHPVMMSEDSGIVHNGVLPLPWSGHKGQSDTVAFAEWARANLPPAWWLQPWIVELVERAIGHNKIVVMSRDNGDMIIGRRFGLEEHGLWYSNDSYQPSTWSQLSRVTTQIGRGGACTLPQSHGWRRGGYSSVISLTTSGEPAVGGWTHEGGDLCLRCVEELRDEVGGPIFREDVEGADCVCDVCGDIL